MSFVQAPKGQYINPAEEIEWDIDDDEWFFAAAKKAEEKQAEDRHGRRFSWGAKDVVFDESLSDQPRVPAGSRRGGQFGTKAGFVEGNSNTFDAGKPAREKEILDALGLSENEYEKQVLVDREEHNTEGEHYYKRILTEDQKTGLGHYAGNVGYQKINNHLRTGEGDRPSYSIQNIDSAISNGAIPKDMPVYRTLRGDWPEMGVGASFHDNGYISVTRDPKHAAFFTHAVSGSAVMRINLKQGQKAVNTSGLGGISKREMEYILPRGSRFRVTGVSEHKNITLYDMEVDGPAIPTAPHKPKVSISFLADVRKSAIVCLVPDAKTRSMFAFSGGEPKDELHITLAYVAEGDSVGLQRAVAMYASTASAFSGEFSGIGRFTGDPDAFYVSLDSPELLPFRNGLVANMKLQGDVRADDTHGFTPHMTLKYLEKDEPLPVKGLAEAVPVVFDSVWIWSDGERTEYRLGEEAELIQTRHPAGSPKGGQFAGKEGGGAITPAHAALHTIPDGAGGARWIKQNQALYDSDPEFKEAVDVLTVYTQGGYQVPRAVAADLVTGESRTFAEMSGQKTDAEDWPYGARKIDEMTVAKGVYIGDPKTYFQNQNLDTTEATYKGGGATIQRAIANSPGTTAPIYRGIGTHDTPFKEAMAKELGPRPNPKINAGQEEYDKVYEWQKRANEMGDDDFWMKKMHPIGGEMEIHGPTSFTHKEDVAIRFMEKRGKAFGNTGSKDEPRYQVMYRIAPGAKGINVSPLSPWKQNEVLTAGVYKVTNVTQTKKAYRQWQDPTKWVVDLEQVGVWDV